jgi:type II secretory pathway pseudopilin PulG
MQNSNLPIYFRRALTLTELVVVLAILVAIAGIVIPRLGSTTDTARETVAFASAIEVRDAVLQFWSDCKYAYPTNPVADQRIRAGHLFEIPTVGSFTVYDPDVRLGWNGPYLDSDGRTYVLNATAGFTSSFGIATDLAVRDPFINQDLDGNGIQESGSPFVIHEPTLLNLEANAMTYSVGTPREIRVVSAGPDGIIDIDETRFASELAADPTLKGDDIYVSFTLR